MKNVKAIYMISIFVLFWKMVSIRSILAVTKNLSAIRALSVDYANRRRTAERIFACLRLREKLGRGGLLFGDFFFAVHVGSKYGRDGYRTVGILIQFK